MGRKCRKCRRLVCSGSANSVFPADWVLSENKVKRLKGTGMAISLAIRQPFRVRIQSIIIQNIVPQTSSQEKESEEKQVPHFAALLLTAGLDRNSQDRLGHYRPARILPRQRQ
jgi:hypothetical protein